MRRRLAVSIATVPLLVVLGLALAGAATAGGGCHEGGETASTGSSAVVRISGCTYGPTINQVPVGVAVTFLNTSSAPHDVTGRSFAWGSDVLENGASYSYQFTKAGIYPYSCSLHPGMAGVVIVGPTDMTLASDVQPPAQPAATTTSTATAAETGSPIGMAVAGGAGLVVGALGAGLLARRRARAE
jgi:plastocyanin